MGYNEGLYRGARRVVLAQLLLMLLAAGGFGVAGGADDLLAAVYGGAVTVIVTGWLAWRLRAAGAEIGSIYLSWTLRYMAVALLLGAGLGYLKLSALPLLGTFAATQLGFLALLRAPRV